MKIWKAFILVIFMAKVIAVSAVGQSLGRPAPTKNNKLIGNTSEAHSVLAQAKSAALRIKDDFQRRLVLDEIGGAEAKSGDLDAAVETANRAYPHTIATLTAIGKELGNSNDLSKAKYFVSKLKSGGSSTVFAFMAQPASSSSESLMMVTATAPARHERGTATPVASATN